MLRGARHRAGHFGPDPLARNDEKKKGGRTPTNVYPTSAPVTARRALKRSALACRRSATALAAATERHSSTPDTRFLGPGVLGCYPSLTCPSPASFSQTGHDAGRAYVPGAARERR